MGNSVHFRWTLWDLAAESGRCVRRVVTFIWSVADVLRGNFRQSEFSRIILPFTVLRRQE